MELILTKQLLGAFIKDGYQYFLCKSVPVQCVGAAIKLTLKPVRTHPMLHCLPDSYQRYYTTVSQELLQMAAGLPGTLIVVDLNDVRLEDGDEQCYLADLPGSINA